MKTHVTSTLIVLLSIALVSGVAEASWMELVGTPTPVIENGQPGWEYWYDVYADGIAPTQLILGGFDGTQTLNLNGGSLYQRWDSSAAGYFNWGRPNDYPSMRQQNGPDEWVLTGHDWAMDNPIHLPSAYADVYDNSMWAGGSSEDGIHFGYAWNSGFRSGLFMTIRLVHPLGPGLINYSICGWVWEHLETPIIGPAVATVTGDFDGDGDVDADDINELCDNIGGDPATYDMDGDGDVDEDDMIYHIEILVELQDGSGRAGTKRGDFNLDGFVDGTDLALMKTAFGQPLMNYADGNANCDAFVDGTDLAILKTNFGFIANPAGGVPEPATLSLLALGATGLAAKRRRKS